MALTESQSSRLSATIAENAAAEAKSYAKTAIQAEDFSVQAQASADEAAAAAASASEASTSSAASESNAAAAAAAAEAAANNAALAANVFASLTEAQIAIDNGLIPLNGLFNVLSSVDTSFLDQYQNISGVATPTGKSYPSDQFVNAVLDIVNTEIFNRKVLINSVSSNSLSGFAEVSNDKDGNVPEFLTEDGVRHVAALAIGPVRDESPVLKQTSAGASLSGGELNFFNTAVKNIPQPTSGLYAGAILIDVDENNNVRRVIYNDGREVVGGVPPGDKEVVVPAVLGRWVPDYKIYQRRDGSFYSDFDIDKRKPFDLATADHVVYADLNAPDGGDGSISAPFNSLSAINGLTGKVYLRARPGAYVGAKSFVGASIAASSLVMDCWGGGTVISSTENTAPATWIKTTNYTNIYETPVVSGSIGSIVDKSVILRPISGSESSIIPAYDTGDLSMYRQVLTMDELDSTPGTCRFNASKTIVYIHTFRSRVPDADIVTYRNVINFDYSQPNAVLWMSDYAFHGGTPVRVATGRNAATIMKIYGKRTQYKYAGESISAGYVTNGSCISYHDTCVVSANTRDGFGYHGIWPLIANEFNCIGRRNGFDLAESNNGTTMHDGGYSVRLNCSYPENQNRNVHDINSSQNWLVNCIARDATGPINNRYDFIAGAGDSTDNTITVLQNCTGIGSTYNLATWQGALTSSKLYISNTLTDGLVYPSSNIEML